MGPNRLVFCFAPHAARVIVDASAAMPVPLGIAAEDAVYLPSVETALSLVQDAREYVAMVMWCRPPPTNPPHRFCD